MSPVPSTTRPRMQGWNWWELNPRPFQIILLDFFTGIVPKNKMDKDYILNYRHKESSSETIEKNNFQTANRYEFNWLDLKIEFTKVKNDEIIFLAIIIKWVRF